MGSVGSGFVDSCIDVVVVVVVRMSLAVFSRLVKVQREEGGGPPSFGMFGEDVLALVDSECPEKVYVSI